MTQRIACRCGNVINLSIIPAEGEFAYISSDAWDELVKALSDVASKRAGGDTVLLREALSDVLAAHVSYFYQCQQCGRVIFKSQADEEYEFYSRDK